MKAYTHTRSGLPSKVLTPSTLSQPTLPSPTHILVRISHCALNPAGSIVMQLLPFSLRASPAIPELDFSGTIVALGSNVPTHRNFAPGTRVFGSIPLGAHVKSTCGALAEYVVVRHVDVVRVPEGVGLSGVAGLGVAGATALELLRRSGLERGDAVLVNGAGGGIGHLVVQMCCEKVGETGRVVAVCSEGSCEWVGAMGMGYGVVEVVDRGGESVVPRLVEAYGEAKFDAVIDCVGIQDVWTSCPAYFKEGKPYVTVGPRAYSYTYLGMLGTLGVMAINMLWPRIFGGTPRRYVQVAAASSLESLEKLAGMVEKGRLNVHVGMLVPWEDVKLAYERMLSGHASGKIVVDVQGDREAGICETVKDVT